MVWRQSILRFPLVLAVATCIAAAILTPLARPALGQEVPVPAPSTPADKLEELRRLLNDPEVQALMGHAGAAATVGTTVPAEAPAGSGIAMAVDHRLAELRERAVWFADAVRALPVEIDEALLLWSFELSEGQSLALLVFIAIFLATGWLCEWAFWRSTRSVRLRIVGREIQRPIDAVKMTALRLIFAVASVLVFALASLGAFLVFDWPPLIRLMVVTYLTAFLVVRVSAVLGRFAFAPWVVKLRLIAVPDAEAMLLYRATNLLVGVAAFGFLTVTALNELGFLTKGAELLKIATGFVLALVFVGSIWRMAALRGAAAGGPMRVSVWAIAATWAVPLAWLAWAFGLPEVAAVLLVVVVLPLGLDACALLAGRRRDEAAGMVVPSPWTVATERLARLVFVLAALLFVLTAFGWSISVILSAGSNDPSSMLIGGLFRIAVAVLLADVVWATVKAAIDRRLADQEATMPQRVAEEHGEGPVGSGSRLRTLLPLLRNTLLTVLVGTVVMIGLSSLGIDIGPLLAGAGVAGIAIGFGAQALVRDIVSGVFFLIDDAFRIGEYIEIGSLSGTVEAISIRSLRLRHHRGAIHTVPFGEVRSMTNHSRDWVIVKLEFRVPFGTDLGLVKKIVKQVGRELTEDPAHGPNLLDPPKSQGVRRIEEFNLVVGVKFTARPGEQFTIRRDTYHRLLAAFEANGIRLPSRDVEVRVPGGDATGPALSKAAAYLGVESTRPAAAGEE